MEGEGCIGDRWVGCIDGEGPEEPWLDPDPELAGGWEDPPREWLGIAAWGGLIPGGIPPGRDEPIGPP